MIKSKLMPALCLACVLLFGACNESVISEMPEDPVTVTFNVSTLNVDTQPMSRAASSGTELGEVAFALGLIKAAAIIEDGRLDENIKNRYSSFNEGIGKTVLDGTADLCSLAAHAEKLGNVGSVASGRQEYLESVVNQVLFS